MLKEEFMVEELLKEYIFRPDLKVLISKKNEKYFVCKNETSVKFIEKTYENKKYENIINTLIDYYKVKKEIIEKDYSILLDSILNAKSDNKYRIISRGGIPEWLDIEKIKFPFAIEIELTRRCNWNCKFCYNVWKHSDKPSQYFDLPFDSYKKIIDEAAENGCTMIRLSGGEPTLHPDFYKIIDYTSKKKLKIALFTNASMITNNSIKFYKDNSINDILISLHGTEKLHNEITGAGNSYKDTLKKIKLIIDNNISASVETILLGKITDEQLIELSNILSQLGVKNWNLMPYVPTGMDCDNIYSFNYKRIPKLMEKLQRNSSLHIRIVCSQKFCSFGEDLKKVADEYKYIDCSCGSGIMWLSISYDGKIRNCPHSNVYAGDISEGIMNVYETKLKPAVKNILLKQDDECIGCEVFNKCRGGCYLSKINKY